MFLTGNGKGYDYALRSEADIYVFLALIGMVFWACCTIPTFGFLTKECSKLGRNHRFIPPSCLFACGVPGHLPVGMGQLFDAVWCERMKGVGDHAGAAEEDAGVSDL